MPKIAFPLGFGDRRFQLWRFGVSHGVLLLRSAHTKEYPTRIDIMFRAVSEMRLRRGLDDLSIDLLAEHDPRLAELAVSVPPNRHVFALSARGFPHGYVAAASMSTAEGDLSLAGDITGTKARRKSTCCERPTRSPEQSVAWRRRGKPSPARQSPSAGRGRRGRRRPVWGLGFEGRPAFLAAPGTSCSASSIG
ncbi:hypothetical protein [Amycolatopsis alkalitolerans]|uniref:hypothetical protein n=1 Tax=Amycolatopsis alkalitolerans TaxID=2547244 RepID=UPI00135BCF4E|nr:hypothetical protein [Amycolatopsis alkalitolerans]